MLQIKLPKLIQIIQYAGGMLIMDARNKTDIDLKNGK